MRSKILLLTLIVFLPSCAIYQADLQQGNVISPAMVAQLKPSMTRSQVRYILGTPPIVDPFHADEWVYYYSDGKLAKVKEQRRMVVRFNGDIVSSIQGNAAIDSAAAITYDDSVEVTEDSDPVKAKRKKKGIIDRIGDKLDRHGPDEREE